MQHRPEEVARYTVERNGGEYTTDITDVLSLFGRKQLTDAARKEVREALQAQRVGTDPDLLVAQRSDPVRLFLLEAGPVRPPARRSLLNRTRPRTWKGWLGYGFVALLIALAVSPDAKEAAKTQPDTNGGGGGGAQATSDAQAEAREERAALRREREKLREQRAQLRRERAQARRQRARARRIAAAREQERQEELAAQAAAAAEPEPVAASCHPSYDPCLDPSASDYDCEGGSGDGPMYTGSVTVKGGDDYGLDNDGDGTGCDS